MKTKLCFDNLDIVTFLNGLVFFAPVSLLVRTLAGVTLSQFFLLQAILSFSIFICEIPAGKFTDKFGYKNTLVLSQITLFLARLLLFTAFISKSFQLFLLEAIIEGLASSFSSGTKSAYIYTTFPADTFVAKNARVRNWGTIGFIVSTVSYACIYSALGIKGLLISTLAANILGILFSFGLKKESSLKEQDYMLSQHSIIQTIFQRKAILIVTALSVISIGQILINFFYIDKLVSCSVREEWMTLIILGYSTVELLAEKVLSAVQKKYYLLAFAISFSLSAISMILFGISHQVFLVIFLMLIMPLLLDIPSCILNSIQNEFIDAVGQVHKRAEILSIFHMWINLFEIIFLFASSAFSKAGVSMCFFILGFFMLATGWIMYHVFSRGSV